MKQVFLFLSSLLLFNYASGQCFNSEQEYKDYFETNIQTLDPIEGIWSSNFAQKEYYKGELKNTESLPNNATIFIIKNNDHYISCYLSKSGNYKSGPTYTKTTMDYLYLYSKTVDDKKFGYSSTYKANAILTDQSLLEYSYKLTFNDKKSKDWDALVIVDHQTGITTPQSDADKVEYLNDEEYIVDFKLVKISPNESSNKSLQPSSGTGFALTSNGLIVTNNHVVNGAKSIIVKGINGDFLKGYNAQIIASDKNNDLAIIRITDILPANSMSKIPYTISNKTSDVGSSVFVLGYPLRASMGDEIKLTNGIISSKSGYQGDITTYQISAPLQPGNSGGPMFDSKGNIIGIVNARLNGAENASYSIKSSYLLNLIETLPSAPKLQKINILANKQFTDKVKIVKNYTYIIEVR